MFASIKKFLNFLFNWKENREVLQWVFRIGNKSKRYVFGFLLINLITMFISLGSSIAGRYVVDAATGFHTEFFFRYIVIMLATTVASILISAVSGMFSGYVSEKFAFGIRADMFDRVQRSAWFKITKYHSGDMLARLTSDVDAVASTVITIVPNIIVTVCQLVIVLCILLRYDPALAVIGLIVGPLGVICAISMRKKYSEYQAKLKMSQSEYYAFLQESLSNISVVKTFQLEDHNNQRLSDIRSRRMKLVISSSALGCIMHSLTRLIYGLGYVAAFSWCAYRLTTASVITDSAGVVTATYTYGTMTLFLSLVSQVQGTIRSIGGVIPKFYSLVISAKRIREITELEREEYSLTDNIPAKVGLRAENVYFSYDAEQSTILQNLTFSIPAGSRVGIVGPSGTGKTTLIRMLLALVSPDSGSLEFIDEQGNTENITPTSRRLISYVPQGNTLLSGTVRANLLNGNPTATEEQMWQALDMAEAAEFLRKIPEGLDKSLTEGSGGLSEGQAQRIAIARALLRDKPVLILDEATSALDEDTEASIFRKLSAGCTKTCFIITHRRSMLKYCDRIITVDENGSVRVAENQSEI